MRPSKTNQHPHKFTNAFFCSGVEIWAKMLPMTSTAFCEGSSHQLTSPYFQFLLNGGYQSERSGDHRSKHLLRNSELEYLLPKKNVHTSGCFPNKLKAAEGSSRPHPLWSSALKSTPDHTLPRTVTAQAAMCPSSLRASGPVGEAANTAQRWGTSGSRQAVPRVTWDAPHHLKDLYHSRKFVRSLHKEWVMFVETWIYHFEMCCFLCHHVARWTWQNCPKYSALPNKKI